MEDFSRHHRWKRALARNIRLQMPPFLLSVPPPAWAAPSPLRARFGIVEQLELYTPEEISQIVTRAPGYFP